MRQDITQLLQAWSPGGQAELNQLMPLVYDELRRIAQSQLRREGAGHTLQGTALVNEAYLKLFDQKDLRIESRVQFFGLAATVIRHILVDHARRRNRLKRGGDAARVTIDVGMVSEKAAPLDVVKLDDALKSLAKLSPEQSRVVELRYFVGLSIEETAAAMKISPATVKRHWVVARVWLEREMAGTPG